MRMCEQPGAAGQVAETGKQLLGRLLVSSVTEPGAVVPGLMVKVPGSWHC